MHEGIAELPVMTRLLFIGLWTQADRAGRLEDRPKRLKANLFPYDNCDVDKLLSELQKGGFIIRYKVNANRSVEDISPRAATTNAGKSRDAGIKDNNETQLLIQITNFSKHQVCNVKEQASILPPIPAPCQHSTSTVQALQEQEGKGKGTGTGTGTGREQEVEAETAPEPEKNPPPPPAPKKNIEAENPDPPKSPKEAAQTGGAGAPALQSAEEHLFRDSCLFDEKLFQKRFEEAYPDLDASHYYRQLLVYSDEGSNKKRGPQLSHNWLLTMHNFVKNDRKENRLVKRKEPDEVNLSQTGKRLAQANRVMSSFQYDDNGKRL